MKAALTLLCGLVALVLPAQATHPTLAAFFDKEWQHTMARQPTWAASLGRSDAPARWPDVSPAAQDEDATHLRAALTELDSLLATNPDLTPDDQLSATLFRHQATQTLEQHDAGLHTLALSPRSGLHFADEHASALPFKEIAHFDHWLNLLRDFPRHTDATITLLREGIRLGITQPRSVIERVLDPLKKQLPNRPEDSPFYAPFRKIPFTLPEPDRQRLAQEARSAIRDHVLPAFHRFDTFFRSEYLPACLPQIGAWQWPGGAEKYALIARHHTTTNLTPEEIHAIGLAEVQRLLSELAALQTRLKFRGTQAEFFTRLRTHPSFFYDTGHQLLGGYENLVEKIEPLLPRLFRTFPKTPVTVASIPSNSAPHTSTAYYQRPATDGSRPGVFTVNLHSPHMRPKWEMMALTLHESIPGHHFQIALTQEQTGLPEFRRHLHLTAYVEGWALYAETLGHELGLYSDPHDHLGQLVYDLWRSVRLVLDTGIHHQKWTRQQAIDYFLANCPKTELDVITEVDRYIAWPGQALAYKIGQLKIRDLRTRAEAAHGPRFDIRAFHDALLLTGPLPLDLLDQRLTAWIQATP